MVAPGGKDGGCNGGGGGCSGGGAAVAVAASGAGRHVLETSLSAWVGDFAVHFDGRSELHVEAPRDGGAVVAGGSGPDGLHYSRAVLCSFNCWGVPVPEQRAVKFVQSSLQLSFIHGVQFVRLRRALRTRLSRDIDAERPGSIGVPDRGHSQVVSCQSHLVGGELFRKGGGSFLAENGCRAGFDQCFLDRVDEVEIVDNLADGLQERRERDDGDGEGLGIRCLETATSVRLGLGRDRLDWSCNRRPVAEGVACVRQRSLDRFSDLFSTGTPVPWPVLDCEVELDGSLPHLAHGRGRKGRGRRRRPGRDHNICTRVVELASVELPPPHDGVPAWLQVGHRPRALTVGRVGRLGKAEAVASVGRVAHLPRDGGGRAEGVARVGRLGDVYLLRRGRRAPHWVSICWSESAAVSGRVQG